MSITVQQHRKAKPMQSLAGVQGTVSFNKMNYWTTTFYFHVQRLQSADRKTD